jgi:hypothetical protein
MKPRNLCTILFAAACGNSSGVPDGGIPGDSPQVSGCTVFPSNNIWNRRVDGLPVDAKSSAYINGIGASTALHADFGSGNIGIPFVVVPSNQATKTVTFTYAAESDPGPYPIPDNPPIEGDGQGDAHVLILQQGSCKLYEIFAAVKSGGSWSGGSGAVFDLRSNALRPDTWTSADAAGLAIFPGLVRYEEVVAGEIAHAIRFTVSKSQKSYVWPARHEAGSSSNPDVVPMGARFRLKNSVDISGYSPELQVILTAMKRYGIIVADNGSNWFISGAPNEMWDNDKLSAIKNIKGGDFEAVNSASLQVDVNSGEAK